MPKINNQHQTSAGAVVPDFVLETVIEDEPLSAFPRSCLLRDTEVRAARNLQSEMSPYSAVGWPAMWPNVSSRVHNAELHLTTFTGSCCGELFHQLASDRSFGTIVGYSITPGKQLKLLPVASIAKVFGFILEISFCVQEPHAFVTDCTPLRRDKLKRAGVSGLLDRPKWP